MNEYTQVGAVYRTHDSNGNLTSANATTMAYDYRNNLTEVKQGQTTIADYEYDVFNRRTAKYCTAAFFYWDLFDLVEIYDANGVRVQRIVHSQDIDHPAVLNVRDDNDLDEDEDTSEYRDYWYGFDMLGSVVNLTDSTGALAESVQYDVYGEPSFKNGSGTSIRASQILNHLLHAGRYYDEETGLYWNRFRTYDPYTGRFLQRRSSTGDAWASLRGGDLRVSAVERQPETPKEVPPPNEDPKPPGLGFFPEGFPFDEVPAEGHEDDDGNQYGPPGEKKGPCEFGTYLRERLR